MAATVSLVTQPDLLAPVNKELWFQVNSGSSSVTNFKYIFKVQEKLEPFGSTSFTALNVYKIPPRPLTGDGLFSPHRLLKSFILNKVNPYQTDWKSGFVSSTAPGIPGALVQYNLKYGYEYNPSQNWADTYFLSGNLGLTFSTPHGLELGDIITLDKDNKTINPSYDGTCSVTQVVDTRLIKTDKPWGVSSLSETGTITSLLRLTATSSNRITYNGTRQYMERTKNFSTTNILTGPTSSFLSTYNQTYKPVAADDYETLSMIFATATGNTFFVDTYNAGGTIIGSYSYPISGATTYQRVDFGVGPKNLFNASSINFANVNTYRVYTKSGGATSSQIKYYSLDTQCSIYDKVRLLFLNRQGGWDYFNFTLDSKRTVAITRTEYEKILDWNYSVGDRGQTILAQKAEQKMTINSNWITEADSLWLEELLTSPEIYVLGNTDPLGGASTGYKLPIVITDTTYEVKTAIRDRLFNLVVNFKYAYITNLQNE
jgi:hypothetical protein